MNAASAPLPPIPVPASCRWREFRRRVLPAVVFVAGLGAAALLWDRTGAAPSFLAEAEPSVGGVAYRQAGLVSALRVDLLQPVAAGEVVACLQIAEPQVVAATLATVRAEIERLRVGLEPLAPAQRVLLERRRLRLDWMKERVALATLQSQLALAETDLARQTRLHREGLVSIEVFETARNLHERLQSESALQTELVRTTEPPTALAAAEESASADQAILDAAIRVQEETLRRVEVELAPVPLRAPIAGIVVQLRYRDGENLPAGEPLLVVAAERPRRLAGYLRQPLAFEPRAGMAVELRTRSGPRQVRTTTIEQVGCLLEPIPPAHLAAVGRAGAPDLGLRIHIFPPPDLVLRPGEQVDVVLAPAGG